MPEAEILCLMISSYYEYGFWKLEDLLLEIWRFDDVVWDLKFKLLLVLYSWVLVCKAEFWMLLSHLSWMLGGSDLWDSAIEAWRFAFHEPCWLFLKSTLPDSASANALNQDILLQYFSWQLLLILWIRISLLSVEVYFKIGYLGQYCAWIAVYPLVGFVVRLRRATVWLIRVIPSPTENVSKWHLDLFWLEPNESRSDSSKSFQHY